MFNIWAQLHIIEPWERPVKCNLYTNTFGNFENYNLNKYIFNIRGQFHTIEPSKRAVKWLSPDPTLQAEMHNQTRHSKLHNFWILTETRKQSFWDLGHMGPYTLKYWKSQRSHTYFRLVVEQCRLYWLKMCVLFCDNLKARDASASKNA